MDNFERLLSLAEFAAKRHEERRPVEFRIFITYLTFLAVIFYHFTKKEGLVRDLITGLGLPVSSSSDPINPWVLIVALLFIHVVYFFWQTTIGIANDNDTRRRNFFLARTECIAQYFIENPHSKTFRPSDQKKVQVVRDGKEDEKRETKFFAEQRPQIILPPYTIGKMIEYSPEFWKNWFRASQFAIPTIMLGAFFFIILDCPKCWLIPFSLLLLLWVGLPLIGWVMGRRKEKKKHDNWAIPKADRSGLLRTRR